MTSHISIIYYIKYLHKTQVLYVILRIEQYYFFHINKPIEYILIVIIFRRVTDEYCGSER